MCINPGLEWVWWGSYNKGGLDAQLGGGFSSGARVVRVGHAVAERIGSTIYS